MTSTTRSTRSWYSSERRLVISCRSPNASSAIGISTTAAKARSRRVRRLITHLGSFAPRDDQSPIPFRSHTGPPAPHNGVQPCLNQRDDGLGIEPSSAIHQGLQVAARVERPAVERHDVTGVGSPPPCQCQRLTASTRWHAGMSAADGPEGARRGTPLRQGPTHGPGRRSARPDRAPRRRPRRTRFAAWVGTGLAAETESTSQSGNICHQNGPRAPRASPRTASSASTCRASSDSEGDERERPGVRSTWVRCQASGTD